MSVVRLIVSNYNSGDQLNSFLKQKCLNSISVYVCDDNSVPIIAPMSRDGLKIIHGDVNLGQAGNVNRILPFIGKEIEGDDILLFMDVDMKMVGFDIKGLIDHFEADSSVGIIGGKILTKKEEPMWWNYGFEMHPANSAREWGYLDSALKNWEDKSAICKIRELAKPFTYNLEMSFGDQDKPRNVDWVSEANFAIRASTFQKVEGFDPTMRYHSCQDFGKRVRTLGLNIMYSPYIQTVHLEIDTHGSKRGATSRENAFYFYKKHYGMTREIFEYLIPKD